MIIISDNESQLVDNILTVLPKDSPAFFARMTCSIMLTVKIVQLLILLRELSSTGNVIKYVSSSSFPRHSCPVDFLRSVTMLELVESEPGSEASTIRTSRQGIKAPAATSLYQAQEPADRSPLQYCRFDSIDNINDEGGPCDFTEEESEETKESVNENTQLCNTRPSTITKALWTSLLMVVAVASSHYLTHDLAGLWKITGSLFGSLLLLFAPAMMKIRKLILTTRREISFYVPSLIVMFTTAIMFACTISAMDDWYENYLQNKEVANEGPH